MWKLKSGMESLAPRCELALKMKLFRQQIYFCGEHMQEYIWLLVHMLTWRGISRSNFPWPVGEFRFFNADFILRTLFITDIFQVDKVRCCFCLQWIFCWSHVAHFSFFTFKFIYSITVTPSACLYFCCSLYVPWCIFRVLIQWAKRSSVACDQLMGWSSRWWYWAYLSPETATFLVYSFTFWHPQLMWVRHLVTYKGLVSHNSVQPIHSENTSHTSYSKCCSM